MNIKEITIGQAQEIAAMFSTSTPTGMLIDDPYPWRIGKNYFIRTVTYHHTGKLVGVTRHELVLTNAAWIADDGRMTQSLKNCEFNEVEMFPTGQDVIIGRGSLIDAVEIDTIPTSQK